MSAAPEASASAGAAEADVTRVVAIDGPAGTGKSTVSKLLANRVGAQCLDTGAMYRAVTLAVLDRGVPLDDPKAIAEVMPGVDVDVLVDADGTNRVFLDGTDVSDRIRTAQVSAAVSAVSAVPAVRTTLVALQRKVSQGRFVVVEGRDVGTVVFPDAGLKVFLTATAQARAQRRHLQNLDLGQSSDYDEVLAAVNRRDHLDSTRAVSPLRAADDAVLMDTSDLTLDQVLDELTRLVQQRIGAPQ
ncbi:MULTISPECIES: (d)CMP kinase [Gordonia]|uniref:(d)CMP kinase n=1 Tax=Gordonia TaxID=2053 RepID=UPI001FE6B0BB|nr:MULTISPECIES: (d)CMP kinase [Gordonia]